MGHPGGPVTGSAVSHADSKVLICGSVGQGFSRALIQNMSLMRPVEPHFPLSELFAQPALNGLP